MVQRHRAPSRDPGRDQREKEGGRGEEEADGGEGSPGEGQGGGTQQTDIGYEAKTQDNKDRALASDCVFITSQIIPVVVKIHVTKFIVITRSLGGVVGLTELRGHIGGQIVWKVTWLINLSLIGCYR